MLSLAELQADFRRAIGSDTAEQPAVTLVAPGDPLERLSIYRRHFRESFRRHLRGRFPTVEWLIGTPKMIELADALVRTHPPKAPSLAEYGNELATALAGELSAGLPPYLSDVARIDWQLGNVAIATTAPPRAIADLAALPPETMADATLSLQMGTVYLASAWPVDTLVGLRLSKSAPDRLEFAPENVWLELRGARGHFNWKRLTASEFAFRAAFLAADPLGAAAESGLAKDPQFDVSMAIASLFAERLVTALQPSSREH